jgi:hypothetical protein
MAKSLVEQDIDFCEICEGECRFPEEYLNRADDLSAEEADAPYNVVPTTVDRRVLDAFESKDLNEVRGNISALFEQISGSNTNRYQ